MTALGKLGSCEICSSKAAIYKCPKCEMVTCSLECSKRHKRLKNFCDGIRDKTKYVPLKKFGYMELVSDMSLMESASRYCTNQRNRDAKPIVNDQFHDGSQRQRWKQSQLLQRACKRRNGCKLEFLPQHFSRHFSNTTSLDAKNDAITWKVVCILPHVQQTLTLHKVSEANKLMMVLEFVLKKVEPLVTKEDFHIYSSARPKDLAILLKQESRFPNTEGTRYIEMDLTKSLVYNLQGSSLIEHPVIVIAHQSHAAYFQQGSEDPLNLDDFNQIQEELATTDIFGNFQNSSEEEKEISSCKPVVVDSSLITPTPKPTESKTKSSLFGLVSYPSSEDEI